MIAGGDLGRWVLLVASRRRDRARLVAAVRARRARADVGDGRSPASSASSRSTSCSSCSTGSSSRPARTCSTRPRTASSSSSRSGSGRRRRWSSGLVIIVLAARDRRGRRPAAEPRPRPHAHPSSRRARAGVSDLPLGRGGPRGGPGWRSRPPVTEHRSIGGRAGPASLAEPVVSRPSAAAMAQLGDGRVRRPRRRHARRRPRTRRRRSRVDRRRRGRRRTRRRRRRGHRGPHRDRRAGPARRRRRRPGRADDADRCRRRPTGPARARRDRCRRRPRSWSTRPCRAARRSDGRPRPPAEGARSSRARHGAHGGRRRAGRRRGRRRTSSVYPPAARRGARDRRRDPCRPGQALGPAGIPDANGPGLRGPGRRPPAASRVELGIAHDRLDDVLAHLEAALWGDADAIIVSGGVSVGPYDVVRTAFEAIGTIEIWRVAVQPGKPFAFGDGDRPGEGHRRSCSSACPATRSRASSRSSSSSARRSALWPGGATCSARSIGRSSATTSPRARAGARSCASTAERDATGAPIRDERGRVRVTLSVARRGRGATSCRRSRRGRCPGGRPRGATIDRWLGRG